MKNIKKLLALALVLVLALGMVPFSASAAEAALMTVYDFTDSNEIQYKEAADVLAALGVYQGEGDAGSRAFHPQRTISRAEAATIMARVLLGTAPAEALPLGETKFSDVPAGHWAAGYVGYGSDRGIIAGFEDGTFRPNDPVTAVQMAKMLLGAVGYGVNGEFEGDNWDFRVIDRGMQLGVEVLSRTGMIDYTAPATREEVAQYTFNALTIPSMVSWNSTINDYSSWSDVQWQQVRPNLGRYTFDLIAVATRDGYGFAGVEWTIEGTRWRITGFYTRDEILGTSVNGTPIDITSGTSRSLTTRGRQGFVAELGRVWVDQNLALSTWGPNTAAAWFSWSIGSIPMYVNGRWVPVSPGVSQEASDLNGVFTQGEQSVLSRNDALMLAAIPGVTVHLADQFPYDGRVSRIVIIAPTVHEAAREPIVTGDRVTVPGVFPRFLQYRQTGTNEGIYQFGTGTNANMVPIASPTSPHINRLINDLPAHEVEYYLEDGSPGDIRDIREGDILLVHEKVVEGISITVIEKAEAVRGQMTTARTARPNPNITFDGRVFPESGLTPGALFEQQSNNGNPMITVFPEYQEFAVTQHTADGNFNQDAILFLDHAGGVVVAKLDEPGIPPYGLVLEYARRGAGIGTGREVRLATVDGNVGVYNVAASPGLTSEQTYERLDQLLLGTEATVGQSHYVVELIEYRLVGDSEVAFIFRPNNASTPAVIAANQNNSGPVSSYSARVPTIVVDGQNFQIAGDTAVYYYSWSTSSSAGATDYTGRNLGSAGGATGNVRTYVSSTDNLVFVGYGPQAASQGWTQGENGVNARGVRFTQLRNRAGTPTSILSAIVINMENSRAGTETYAFVTTLGTVGTDGTTTPRVFEYDVWLDGVAGHQIRSTSENLFSQGAGGVIGLVSYIPNPVTGLVPVTQIGTNRMTIPFANTTESSYDVISQQEMADARVLMARSAYSGGRTAGAINWVNTAKTSVVAGSFNVDSATRWYQVQRLPAGGTTVIPGVSGPDISNPPLGTAYAIRGVQPAVGAGPETPVAAVYFEILTGPQHSTPDIGVSATLVMPSGMVAEKYTKAASLTDSYQFTYNATTGDITVSGSTAAPVTITPTNVPVGSRLGRLLTVMNDGDQIVVNASRVITSIIPATAAGILVGPGGLDPNVDASVIALIDWEATVSGSLRYFNTVQLAMQNVNAGAAGRLVILRSPTTNMVDASAVNVAFTLQLAEDHGNITIIGGGGAITVTGSLAAGSTLTTSGNVDTSAVTGDTSTATSINSVAISDHGSITSLASETSFGTGSSIYNPSVTAASPTGAFTSGSWTNSGGTGTPPVIIVNQTITFEIVLTAATGYVFAGFTGAASDPQITYSGLGVATATIGNNGQTLTVKIAYTGTA